MKIFMGTVVFLYFLLITPYLSGCVYERIFRQKEACFTRIFVNGYMLLFAAFWCIAQIFLHRGCTLTRLTMVWLVFTIAINIFAVLISRKKILQYLVKTGKDIKNADKMTKCFLVIFGMLVFVSVLWISPQVENTVPTVATSIETDATYRYHPYTGEQYPQTQEEKYESPYEMLYATITKLSGMHAAGFIERLLPISLLLLFYSCYWEVGRALFAENSSYRSIFLFLIVLFYLVPVFASNDMLAIGIYRNSWNGITMLHSVIFPYGLCLGLNCIRKKEKLWKWIPLFAAGMMAAQLFFSSGMLYFSFIIIGFIIVSLVRKGCRYVSAMEQH